MAAPVPAAEQSSGQFVLSQPGTHGGGVRPGPERHAAGRLARRLGGVAGGPRAAGPMYVGRVSRPDSGTRPGRSGAGEASAGERLGEFLAAGGAAVCQPADGTQKPDYMLLQGSLTPTVQVAYGLVGRGGFRRLLRFDKGPEQTSVPLSAVVQACLDAVGSDAVGLVMVAETAALIGAALQKTPEPPAGGSGPQHLRVSRRPRLAEFHGRSRRWRIPPA